MVKSKVVAENHNRDGQYIQQINRNNNRMILGSGEMPDGVHNEKNRAILGLGLDPIKIRPNCLQTLYAMLRLRVLRLFRNIQLLYFMIVAPLALVALGLYLNSIQTVDIKMQSLELSNGKYFILLYKQKMIKFRIKFNLYFSRYIWK